MKFFKCDICGNFVEMVKESGVSMMCCGQNMTELLPGTSDGAHEKHVPVYSVNGNTVSIQVGSTEHPMMEGHFIAFIAVETDQGAYRITRKPGDAPKAELTLADGEIVLGVYAYCNLHGLWKAV